MHRPLTVVFDFFGVLVQDGMSISGTLYNMVREHVGYEPMWTTYMNLTLGRGDNREFWEMVAPPGTGWEEMQERFFAALTPEPGVAEVIASFRELGARLAILSEIPEEWLEPMLARLGLAGQFEVAVTSGGTGVNKPEPAIFEILMAELGEARPDEQRFYVDDRLTNLEVGERYGLASIWMRRGASPVIDFQPRHVVTSVRDALEVVSAGKSGPGAFSEARATVLDELNLAMRDVEEGAAMQLVERIMAAPRVFIYGRGRTGLAAWAFASRLAQMGLEVHVVGEMTAPAISSGDLLVAASGTGTTRTTLLAAEEARRIGAGVVALTTHPDSPLGRSADLVVRVEGATRRRGRGEEKSVQYGGSLFEQALLLTLDAVAMVLKRRLARSDQEMDRRHANLE
jgi:6-phospho-3-hexuloisomerase